MSVKLPPLNLVVKNGPNAGPGCRLALAGVGLSSLSLTLIAPIGGIKHRP
jgi:hypothetical protein